jgi:polysaccharide export outer membrane protein
MTARFHSKSIAKVIASSLTAVAMAATAVPCAAQAQPARPTTASPAQAPARTAAPPPVVAAPGLNLPPEYTIGADDVLSIVFWRDKELTADVTVRPDGKVSLPLLNDVQASGLTPAQLKDRIVEESKKYVEDPNVTVVVKEIRSRKVYITGEVRKPGPYALTGAMTVLQMISIAGGLADYARPDKISIVRVENGKPASFKFNYKEVIDGKKLHQNIELKPGDTIIVP